MTGGLDLFKGRKAILALGEPQPQSPPIKPAEVTGDDDNDTINGSQSIALTDADVTTVHSCYDTIAATCAELARAIDAALPALTRDLGTITQHGNSLYSLKFDMFVDYLLRLGQIMLAKIQGQSLADSAVVDELVRLRVVFDRMKMIEGKMKYSIDKLLNQMSNVIINAQNNNGQKSAKAAKSKSKEAVDEPVVAGAGGADPLSFAPNPLDLLSSRSVNTADAHAAIDTRTDDAAGDSLYRPPRLTSVSYSDSVALSERRAKQTEKLRDRASSSSFIRSMMNDASDRPEERKVEGAGVGEMGDDDRVDHDRTRFEEEYMVRLVETKQDKRDRKKRQSMRALDQLDDFDELKHFIKQHDRDTKRPRIGSGLPSMGEIGGGGAGGGRKQRSERTKPTFADPPTRGRGGRGGRGGGGRGRGRGRSRS